MHELPFVKFNGREEFPFIKSLESGKAGKRAANVLPWFESQVWGNEQFKK